MAHWKVTLSYNGEPFHGWQVQPGCATVQGTLAEALRQITGESVLPQGAGRTDAGVHALAQVASFTLRSGIPVQNLQRALNRVLPPAVRVTQLQEAPPDFHARHSARRKFYEYRIFDRPALPLRGDSDRTCSPFLAPFVWDCRWPLRLDLLQAAAKQIVGTRDFSAMAATGKTPKDQVPGVMDPQAGNQPNPVKTIHHSTWEHMDNMLVYRVCGSGFLHHMVRNLVGTMVDIGRGSTKLEALEQILRSRDRSLAGPTAPASGLYLVRVGYEPESYGTGAEGWPTRADFIEPKLVITQPSEVLS